jgi:hypothetical protein
MVDSITKTGSTQNQTLQLSEKINKLEARTTTLNIERINTDLAQVKEENEVLIKFLQAKSKATAKK